MTDRFRGEGIHKVDGKGRVSIPVLFRRVLESGDPDWTEGLNPNAVIVYGGTVSYTHLTLPTICSV